MNLTKYHLAIAVIGLLISGCNKSNDSSSLFGSYDQKAMLSNTSSAVLLPAISQFELSANAVVSAINTFNAQTDLDNLQKLQNAFLQLAKDWATEEPFNFGPISDNLWYVQINTWPVKTYKVENAIAIKSIANTQGADAKGMKALEYLLFDTSTDNRIVLAKYTQSTDAGSRKSYLLSVAKDIADKATSLKNAWIGPENFNDYFLKAQGNDVSSSIGQLVNAIALSLDEVKNMKVGNAIGLGVKVNDNLPHPENVEYTRVAASLTTIQQNITSMKAAFNGGSGQGLDDLLDFVKAKKNGENLSQVVNAQFEDVATKMSMVNSPFQKSVVSQTQDIVNLFKSLKTLIAYFKVDVANNLGVTITFSDTDGD